MNPINNGIIRVPEPVNEPQLDYAVNSAARSQLKTALSDLAAKRLEIPLLIGGEEIKTGNLGQVVMPHEHGHVLADYHQAGENQIQMAIAATMDAKPTWQRLRWEERAAIFLKAAELISGKYRFQINAAAMLSTSKNAYQAEIDAACEMIDFLRFNVHFAQTIYAEQPLYSSKGTWNFTQYRPLEGFVLAVTPFNFTAIAGNLAAAPAIMGNTVILKPASSCVYTPWLLMQIFKEAGLPDGVINFLPGPGSLVGDICLASPDLGGVHLQDRQPFFSTSGKPSAATSRPTSPIRASSEKPAGRISSSPIVLLMYRSWLPLVYAGPLNIRGKSARQHRGPTFQNPCGLNSGRCLRRKWKKSPWAP